MRKILIPLLIVIALAVTMSIFWLFCGRQLSMLVDRFETIETASNPVTSLTYEGNGIGGFLLINDHHLNLDTANPQSAPVHIGTTKDRQLALSFGGKVFPFGPLSETPESADEILATTPQPGDHASIAIRRSALSWIEPLKLQGPSRKRHLYYQLVWEKPSGAKLEMIWRYEQHFHPGSGWGSGFMTYEGTTGLINIDIRLKE